MEEKQGLDTKRFVLFLALSMGVLYAWNWLVPKPALPINPNGVYREYTDEELAAFRAYENNRQLPEPPGYTRFKLRGGSFITPQRTFPSRR